MDYSSAVFVGGGLIGLVMGALVGIFGVGGGFLTTPVLIIFLSVPGQTAVGTELATILAISSFGMLRRRGSGTVDLKLGFTIAVGSVAGVLAGSTLLSRLSQIPDVVIFGKEQDTVQYLLLIIYVIMLTAIAVHLALDYKRSKGQAPEKRIGLLAKVKCPPYSCFNSLEEPQLSVVPLVLIGFAVGSLTGLTGIGGGVVLLPALVYLVGQRTIKAAGTSLVLVWISSLVAVIRKGASGEIDLPLLLVLLIGGFIGAYLSTHIGLKLEGPKIRLYFIYVIMAAVLIVGCEIYRLTL